MAPRKRKPERKPWHPATWDMSDARALQALAKGEAGPIEQKRALDWIVVHAAQTYDNPFDPDSARVTDYVLGRRAVGLEIVKLLKLKLGLIEERGMNDGRSDTDE